MNKQRRAKRTSSKHKTTLPGGNRYGHNEAASFLGLTPGTLAKWRSVGRPFIPYFKIGKKVIYIEDDLSAYLAKRRVDVELGFPSNWCGKSEARLCAVERRLLSDQIETVTKPRDTELQALLTNIADTLREKGAGHLSDEIENAAPNQLPAIAEAVAMGGYHEEATELQTVVSEIFNPLNQRKI